MEPIARFCLLVVLVIFGTITAFSQSEECGTIIDPDDPQYAIDLEQLGGIYFTAEDTVRILLVFVQFPEDENYHPYWPAHQPPTNMAQYIDQTASINSSNFSNVTNYFRQMSRALYVVIGDTVFVEAPHTLAWYNKNGYGRAAINKDVLANAVNPRVNFANYDNWQRVANYRHEKQGDYFVDMIFMIWRGLQFNLLGEASIGYGNDTLHVDGVKVTFGYPNGSGLHCSFPYSHWPEKLLQTMVHELGHWLLGSSHPYGGAPSYAHWSILGQQFNAGVCANAFERERLAWISVPTVPFNENISLGDFIDGGIAYKYQPANAEANEYYWIENHQKLSVYDDATTNPNDKGVWILHQSGLYNNSARLRIRPTDGFWNWNNPSFSTQCLSQSLPVFAKGSVNRTTGRSHRDQLLTSSPSFWDWMHDYQDISGALHCGGFFRGDPPFYGAFNTTYSSVFSRWSSPATGTWANQLDTSFAMEAKTQFGDTITVRFYNTPADAPPSKPMDLRTSVQSQGGDNHPRLDWAAMQEADVASGGKLLIYRRTKIGSGNWGSWFLRDSVSGTATSWVDNQINTAGGGPDSLQYKIQARDSQSKLSVFSDVASIRWFQHGNKIAVGGVETEKPTTFGLDQNYPNPFNPSTTIKYQLAEDGIATLRVFDVLGREVTTIAHGFQPAGYYSATFNADQFASGVYFVRFVVADEMGRTMYTQMSKLLLVR